MKWDAKRAFLKSGRQREWKRTVCLKPPKEARVPPGWVWEALRAVYGLGDGPTEWNTERILILLAAAFVQIASARAVSGDR